MSHNYAPFNDDDEETNPYRANQVSAAPQSGVANSCHEITNTRTKKVVICNIQWNRNDPRSTAEKIALIESSALQLETQRHEAIGILTAPEYFWSHDGNSTTTEYGALKQWLEQLSIRYPQILFIPGTISYSEQITADNHATFQTALRETEDVVRVPAFDLQQQLEIASVGKYIVRNTALIACNGQVIMEYGKRCGFNELSILRINDHVYLPGQVSGLFTWSELYFGVEICLDHDVEVLDNNLQENAVNNIYMLDQSNSEQRRIHIILSDFVHNKDQILQRILNPRGLLIHSSTYFYHQQVMVITPSSATAPTTDNNGEIVQTRVDYVTRDVTY
eukprot:gene24032-32443_t